jgi:hypothetical protein
MFVGLMAATRAALVPDPKACNYRCFGRGSRCLATLPGTRLRAVAKAVEAVGKRCCRRPARLEAGAAKGTMRGGGAAARGRICRRRRTKCQKLFITAPTTQALVVSSLRRNSLKT